MASLVRWYAMAQCFFLSTDDGTVVFRTTLLLSPNNKAEPSILTPSILKVYLTSIAKSTAILAACGNGC